MSVLLLDTNALIWFVGDARQLGRKALRLAEQAVQEERLAVSAITFWEVAQLVDCGRLHLRNSVAIWRRQVLGLGIHETPLHGDVAIRSTEVMPEHRDPADRFILATALETGASLMTSDRRLLDWYSPLVRYDARA